MPDRATDRRVALVTGAARGLGRAIALELAHKAFDVVLNDARDDDALRETGVLVRERGGEAACLAQDIGDIAELPAYVARVRAAFGRLDCLVNNAGVSVLARGDLLDVSAASFDRCMRVNLRGTFFLTQQVARHMLQSTGSPAPQGARRSIITISSTAVGQVIGRDIGEYTVSKAGLVAMTRLFAVRLAEHGIDCFDVRPGMMQTDMTDQVRAKFQALIDTGFIPAKRWGDPAEIGATIANLASGALHYTVGQTVSLDGGQPFKVH